MGIDKLYSKKALIIKAVACFLLPVLYMLASSLISIEDNFIFIVVSLIPLGCIYTVPYWLTLYAVKRFRTENGILRLVLFDAASCIAPLVLSLILTETVYAVIYGETIATGVITAIVALISIILSSIFWLGYLVFSRVK